eukprot:352349-Chlamydomonas_euryale.AAC.1
MTLANDGSGVREMDGLLNTFNAAGEPGGAPSPRRGQGRPAGAPAVVAIVTSARKRRQRLPAMLAR